MQPGIGGFWHRLFTEFRILPGKALEKNGPAPDNRFFLTDSVR
jgi:hypothetical protein